MISLFGKAKRPLPHPSLYKRRRARAACHSTGCYLPKNLRHLLLTRDSSDPPLKPPAPPSSTTPFPTSAMAPKSDKAKGKAVKSAEALRLEALRRERATFPPQLDALELRNRFRLFWSTATRAHPRTRVLPAIAQRRYPTGYPYFAVFFHCGLCPPFSEFFCDIMYTYNLHLLDFTPNAVLTMAVFAHLCENFVGVRPNVALFRHFFAPRWRKESRCPVGSPGSPGLARRRPTWMGSSAAGGRSGGRIGV